MVNMLSVSVGYPNKSREREMEHAGERGRGHRQAISGSADVTAQKERKSGLCPSDLST